MLLFVASALGAAQVGWPCQRLNWGWRNVWSTCSINSFTPAGAAEGVNQAPTHFRFTNVASPDHALNNAGVYTPTAGALPALFCTRAMATGTGATQNMRNRCRRAVDAYGSLVRLCRGGPAATGAVATIGANAVSPDHLPQTTHQPHVLNVQGLTHNAAFCLLPAGGTYAPTNLQTPANTCPGLLGWFTVVFNACQISASPLVTSGGINGANTPLLYTAPTSLGHTFSSSIFGSHPSGTAVSVPVSPVNGIPNVVSFCTPPGTTITAPNYWNPSGPGFRTGRCRKAMDQFGRTAARCHRSGTTLAPNAPAQAGGYTDPLRLLAFGAPSGTTLIVPGAHTDNTPATPMGMISWGPACN